MKSRKTDKMRFKEKRGMGRGKEYRPWLEVHEFSNRGNASRILGWKCKRTYQLMSKLERRFFVLKQFEQDVVEIREQFPLLPLELTETIATELGVTHPPKNSKKKTVMTTDFVLTIQEKDASTRDVAIAIKSSEDLKNQRTLDKLKVEGEYWKRKGIEFEIVTEESINRAIAVNIEFMYQDYFWAERKQLLDSDVQRIIKTFKNLLEETQGNVLEALERLEHKLNWAENEGSNFVYYLITHKLANTNLEKRLDLKKMNLEVL